MPLQRLLQAQVLNGRSYNTSLFVLLILFKILSILMVNPARSSQGELWSWTLFFAGVTAVAFGSSYYHLNPNDATLVWDRLPVSFSWFYCIYAMDLIDSRSSYLSSVLRSTKMPIQH